jgi:hypothetical protein
MSYTRGGYGKRKRFSWFLDIDPGKLIIVKENGQKLSYSLREIQNILKASKTRFSTDYFPLANNVELLSNGTEQAGLGTIILKQYPRDISRAQGASYLGIVLEECGYLKWNGKNVGIEWRLIDYKFAISVLTDRLAYLSEH